MQTARAQRWPLLGLNRGAIWYLIVVETVVASVAGWLVVRGAAVDSSTLLDLGALLLVGAVYAEVVDRVERVWIWMHTDRGAMSAQVGVLLFAGVLVLPMWGLLVQTAAIYLHAALRNGRHDTEPAYRIVWNATTVLAAAAASVTVFQAMHGQVTHPEPTDVLAIGCALVVYSGVNLALLLTGMYLATHPQAPSSLLPTGREIGYEAVKLLLGVLGAVLVEEAPLLLPIIPLLAATLHRSSLIRELLTDASTDCRTGLLTPKAWDRASGAQLAHCRRDDAPISLIMLDLDHFKLVNDCYGHAAGDCVLAAIGGLLGSQVRANDVVGRYGGEEFVVLLPDTGRADALEIAERIRRRIAQLRAMPGVEVTASVGVATGAAAGTDITQLLARADAALYRAKAAGRDRVLVAA